MNQQSERLLKLEAQLTDLRDKLQAKDRQNRSLMAENEEIVMENNTRYNAL